MKEVSFHITNLASPSAAPSIGRAIFDGHTTPGGRTRMMITNLEV